MRCVRGPLATALIALAALAGCSMTEKEKPESESSLKLAHAAGRTRVPARAERVVALTPDALDTALALGVKPVGGATAPDGRFPGYLGRRTAGIERTGTYPKPFLNAVEYVGPDLILGEKDLQGRLYRRLEAIASTVMAADHGHSWEVNTRLFGEAMGRTDQAERLLTRYDRLGERVRGRLDRLGDLEVSVVRVLPTGVRAAGARSFAGTVIGDAGLGRPRAQGAERDAIRPRAPGVLDGDVILLSVAPGAARAAARLQAGAGWRRLRAVRAGRVHRVADDPWRTGGGVLGAGRALLDLERSLAG